METDCRNQLTWAERLALFVEGKWNIRPGLVRGCRGQYRSLCRRKCHRHSRRHSLLGAGQPGSGDFTAWLSSLVSPHILTITIFP